MDATRISINNRWMHRLFALALLAACGRVGFEARDATSDDALATGPFGSPVPIAELNVVTQNDDPELSRDERSILFTRNCEIWSSTRPALTSAWPTPARAQGLNVSTCESGPALSGDELQLWFAAYPDTTSPFDIFTATRVDESQPWQSVQRVDELSVAGRGDGAPSVTADGSTIVFQSSRNGPDRLFISTRAPGAAWSAPVEIDGLTPPGSGERSPHLSRDGRTLTFISNASGSRDLWISTRPDTASAFPPAVHLPEVSGPDEEDDPWLSPDGRRLYFARVSSNVGQLYFAER